jgi:phosphodiesterase/alkaline phosphatase D-like protein
MRRLFLAAAIATSLVMSIPSQAQSSSKNAQSVKSDAAPAIKITHGPTVEFAGSDRAIVAWSTNVSGATIVHYGTDENNLTGKAMAPWGALTHRVTLKNLQPNTTYFFKVDSTENGSAGSSTVQKFQTKDRNQSASN